MNESNNESNLNVKQKIVILSTGGTIEKTYDEESGILANRGPQLQEGLFSVLRLPYTFLEFYSILSKDSAEMNDGDRAFLTTTIKHHLDTGSPILILHGTDTMEHSARHCLENIPDPDAPVIFTGAMKPFGLKDSDAKQNVAEALIAAKILSPGVYISFHNRIFEVPNVRKNREMRTFESF